MPGHSKKIKSLYQKQLKSCKNIFKVYQKNSAFKTVSMIKNSFAKTENFG